MKNVFILLSLLFVSLSCFSQEPDKTQWLTLIDTSAFNGISKQCGVIGKSNDAVYTDPQLGIMKRTNEEVMVYLTYWPYGGCGVNLLYVKFDKEPNLYLLRTYFASNTDQFIVNFYTEKQVLKDPTTKLTLLQFIEKLKTGKILYLKLISTCISIETEFTLVGADEALEILK